MQKGATYILCHWIARQLSEKNHLLVSLATSALLCGHVMSGCDTVSYPFRRGKKKAYKVVMSAAQDITALTTYGDTDASLSDEGKKSARFFYLKLYGNFDGNLDEVRVHAFSTTKGDLRCLPPTEDAFHCHMLRALFQILICKAAQQNHPNIPAPTSFGREMYDEKLVPIMMDKPSRPPAATVKQYCTCVKSKCTMCSCP